MTATRRQRKLRICRPRAGLALAAVVAAGLGLAGPIGAATTERVVIDRFSGLAISGFDPVAYFTDAKPLQGKGEFEQVVAGAVWRFLNAGNSAAFKADPHVYMPRFGGYDPVGVARGVASGSTSSIRRRRRTSLPVTATALLQPQIENGRRLVACSCPELWKSWQVAWPRCIRAPWRRRR
jgi:hypothetical protein